VGRTSGKVSRIVRGSTGRVNSASSSSVGSTPNHPRMTRWSSS
jgi:hypothetical protein